MITTGNMENYLAIIFNKNSQLVNLNKVRFNILIFSRITSSHSSLKALADEASWNPKASIPEP